MSRRVYKITVVLALLLLFFILAKGLFDLLLPSKEVIQNVYKSWGNWGYAFYLLIGTIAIFIVPLNFSLIGLAAGFVYGTWIAFLSNWFCKILGNLIGFFLGRKFGPRVLSYFTLKQQEKFHQIVKSEASLMIYFVMSLLPFTPSDALSYFLGATKIKKRVFIPILILGSSGTSFALAYVGSGEAVQNPFILVGMFIVLLTGLAWIRYKLAKSPHLP